VRFKKHLVRRFDKDKLLLLHANQQKHADSTYKTEKSPRTTLRKTPSKNPQPILHTKNPRGRG